MRRNSSTCFLCFKDVPNSGVRFCSDKESSLILSCIFDIPQQKSLKFQEVSYCPNCCSKIIKIGDWLEEIQKLEKQIFDLKYELEQQLTSGYKGNGVSKNKFRDELVGEIRSASIRSTLEKIKKNRVGNRPRTSRRGEVVRILKNISIPNIFPHTNNGTILSKSTNVGIPILVPFEPEVPVPLTFDIYPYNEVDISEPLSEEMVGRELSTAIIDNGPQRNQTVHTITSPAETGSDYVPDFVLEDSKAFPYFIDSSMIGQTSEELQVKSELQVGDSSTLSMGSFTGIQPSLRFLCGVCDAAFADYNLLQEHGKLHLMTPIPESSTNTCTTTIQPKILNVVGNYNKPRLRQSRPQSWRETYRRKNRVRCGDKVFKCTLCSRAFNRKNSFHRHERTHGAPYEKAYCFICKTYLSSKQALGLHTARKHKVSASVSMPRNFSQDLMTPTAQSSKNTSTTTIQPEIRSIVENFNKPRLKRSSLQNWRETPSQKNRVGSDRKVFKCSLCSRTFNRKSSYLRHGRTHGAPYQKAYCSICKTYFSSKQALAVHTTRKHNVSAFNSMP